MEIKGSARALSVRRDRVEYTVAVSVGEAIDAQRLGGNAFRKHCCRTRICNITHAIFVFIPENIENKSVVIRRTQRQLVECAIVFDQLPSANVLPSGPVASSR